MKLLKKLKQMSKFGLHGGCKRENFYSNNNQSFLELKWQNWSRTFVYRFASFHERTSREPLFFRKNGRFTKEEEDSLEERHVENIVRYISYTLCMKHNFCKLDKVYICFKNDLIIKYINSECVAVSNKWTRCHNTESYVGEWVCIWAIHPRTYTGYNNEFNMVSSKYK